LLSGKIECGECGSAYCGARKFSGRNKTLYVTYKCNKKDRQSSRICGNSDIRREYIESFVLDRIADIVFDEKLALAEATGEVSTTSINQVMAAIEKAKVALKSGNLEEIRQVINLYVNKVVVNREHIEVELGMLPIFFVFPQVPKYGIVSNCGGGESDNENATLLETTDYFKNYMALGEIFNVNKDILFLDYKEAKIFAGVFKL